MKKVLTSILLTTLISIGIYAQQTVIEHNSTSADPHFEVLETDPNNFARIFFRNDNTNKWALNAKPKSGTTDVSTILSSPIIFAYDGKQKFGLSSTGTVRINEAYTLPAGSATAGKVLTMGAANNAVWSTPAGGGGSTAVITDIDSDTRITVDNGAIDEDKVRIFLGNASNASTERLTFGDNGHGILNMNVNDDFSNIFVGTTAGSLTGSTGCTGSLDCRSNIGIGSNALQNNERGYYNISLGLNAGLENTDGIQNISIGKDAGRDNIEGIKNISIGSSALENNISNQNIAIGSDSGDYIETGGSNVMIGVEAGRANNGISSNNVYLGRSAGANIFNIPSEKLNNTIIGTSAGYNTQGDNNVFIGFNAGSTWAAGNNRLIIANSNTVSPLIYGEFLNADNLPKLEINGSLQVSDVLKLPPMTADPHTCDATRVGDVYLNSNGGGTPTLSLKVCNGSAWVTL